MTERYKIARLLFTTGRMTDTERLANRIANLEPGQIIGLECFNPSDADKMMAYCRERYPDAPVFVMSLYFGKFADCKEPTKRNC